ncbi:hypothetical protein ACFYNN_32100 [Streptomyces sp. NPDC006978]|uniref:hypothetical protein n=1 Tax=unclassified Streptomyces TaxID=2593676 RepID=UPI002AFDF737|nr:hypothetical protein [Streptomyces sp. S584]
MPEPGKPAAGDGGRPPAGTDSVLRVGSYRVDTGAVERLVAWHGPGALQLSSGGGSGGSSTTGGSAVAWALRQAALRALAAPPRIASRWNDISLRGTDEGPWTLVFRGELARFAERVLHGDVSLSVTSGPGRVTAHAVLTRAGTPAPSPENPR